MPIFEYVCQACDHRFEAIVLGSDTPSCPRCQSRELVPQLSVFAVSAKSSSAGEPGSPHCGTCGDPRGEGACSLDDLD
jgi:putative FmdB family regulatory protein